MMANVVVIPSGVPMDFQKTMRDLNPGSALVFAMPIADGHATEQKTEVKRSTLLDLIDLLKPAILAGATTFFPPAGLAVIGAKLMVAGIGKVEALLAGSPAKERWTIGDMEAEAASVAAVVPQT